MQKGSKIFVAGHRGLVGSAIVRKLRTKGYANILTASRTELDLRRQDAVERFFHLEKPEHVFLCAASVGGILANQTYRAEFIYDNLAIATNVVNSAYVNGVGKLLNLGSSCIYPKFAKQPMTEDCLLTGTLEQTNEAYAVSKIAAIKLCRYYNEEYGTDFISAMPTNLYGPQDNFDLADSHVLAAMIRKFCLAKLLAEGKLDAVLDDVRRYPLGFGLDDPLRTGGAAEAIEALKSIGVTAEAVTLWGSGMPYREFLHVDDLADAAVLLMEKYRYGEIGELINVGTGMDQTIADLAAKVKNAWGYQGRIAFDHKHPDGTPKKLLDVSRLTSLGWRPKISLDEGIKQVIGWYTAQRQQLPHAVH